MRICDLIKDQDTHEAELGHTVLETVRVMVEHNIGAVPVLHNGKLVGTRPDEARGGRRPRPTQHLHG
jgi:predicted transcriptional regulator